MQTKAEAIKISKVLKLEYIVYATATLIPLVLNHPQIIVGSVVNALLFISAIRLSAKHLLPLAIIPSTMALLNNVLFGSFTVFLLYFLPFIWISNWALMAIYKYNQKMNIIYRTSFAIIVKVIILFTVANLYIHVHIVPGIFLQAMGAFQLCTAIIGAIIAAAILKTTSAGQKITQ
jgi:hypothetical protein